MKDKPIPRPERLRHVPRQFSWIDQRLVRDRRQAQHAAQALAIGCAVLSNYVLNNRWTFRDRSHRTGRERLRGLLSFAAVASVGALINYSIIFTLEERLGWQLHAANLVGIAVATLWNYVLNTGLTWGGWKRPE